MSVVSHLCEDRQAIAINAGFGGLASTVSMCGYGLVTGWTFGLTRDTSVIQILLFIAAGAVFPFIFNFGERLCRPAQNGWTHAARLLAFVTGSGFALFALFHLVF